MPLRRIALTPNDRAAFLTGLEPDERRAALARMSDRQRRALRTHWRLWAHPGQLPPAGEWHGWLIMAGRGFGKTRAGAEWIRSVAEADPAARIALVAASLGEARSVMIEGESGLLAIAPRQRPAFRTFAPTSHLALRGAGHVLFGGRAREPAGAGAQPRLVRRNRKMGSQRQRAQQAWDNLMLGLRRA